LVANYTYITFGDAKTALANRLADPGKVFWTDAELGLYLKEALQMFNVLTGTWNSEFVFSAPISPSQIWYDISTIANSPRQRTTTDADVYLLMRYHLLEPPTGSLTSQFTIADFTGALQRRRDEVIQASACNIAVVNLASTVGVRRTFLADNALEVIRARFLPAGGDPILLYRDDNLASQYFESGYLQESPSTDDMLSYDVISVPPLALDVNVAPNTAGQYEALVIQAGPNFVDGTPTVMQMPNDFVWVAKWGAMADLLGRESEATDRLRAAWCQKRYQDGLGLMLKSPWLSLATLNGIGVDTPSLAELDNFDPEWDSTADSQESVVEAGIDFIAASPVPTSAASVGLTVLGNAPLPSADGDFVQVPRDALDSVLSEAQFLAAWKQGGQEFVQAQELDQEFFQYCSFTNQRLKKLGLFVDELRQEGHRQDVVQERQ
jgi:hypothetical protein